MTDHRSRDAWQRLYSKHGLQYGGVGDIRSLEPYLGPGVLTLDAGCGDGKTTELLARRSDVVACDFSREALLSLRQRHIAGNQPNLVECNMLRMPFEDKMFNVVSCIHALSHMMSEQRRAVALELARVMRVGGVILVEVFGRGDLRYGVGEEVEGSTFLRGNGISTHYFSEGEVPDMFPGFEPLSEVSEVRRISLGAVAGKRETIRILMRKKT